MNFSTGFYSWSKKKKKEIFVENNVSKSKRPNKILSKKLILCKLLSDLLIPVFKIVRNKIAILDSQSINYSSLYCKVTCFCRLFNYYQSILKEYNFCWIQITETILNRKNWFITFSVTIFAFAITYVSCVSPKSNSFKQSGQFKGWFIVVHKNKTDGAAINFSA